MGLVKSVGKGWKRGFGVGRRLRAWEINLIGVARGGMIYRRTGGTKKESRGRNPARDSKMAATYSPTIAVPSAMLSLTTLFGMGRGGTSAL